MNFDRNSSNTDEYFVTALQIFDCCGVERSDSLHVDSLMDKFAPFVKNKAEIRYLKTLLDPEHVNPDINVTKLAKALHKYSESKKCKVDLDESFNLKSGQMPQDSDSGISSDGLQLLEELQCELKEKEHLTHQLRNQLDYSDRQHEESLAALTAERDSLRTHLNVVREENATLSHVRKDYEEVCERLCASETELGEAKRELDTLRKRVRVGQDHVAQLESDKISLQELLSKSKDECHRINEMYAARQSALLEANENMKAERAELAARLHDQEHFLQQIAKEKVHLEMELKDVLNKSNQTHLRLDRSIDVSYTDDQMLSALDTLNADSRFSSENRILDEDSFLSALKEDQGRPTNMSLFDEIRMSFCSMSRVTFGEMNTDMIGLDRSVSNNSVENVETQTDVDANQIRPSADSHKGDKFENVKDIDTVIVNAETQTENVVNVTTEKRDSESQTDTNNMVTIGSQTLGTLIKTRPIGQQNRARLPRPKPIKKSIETQTAACEIDAKTKRETETQTEVIEVCNINNNVEDGKCLDCENARKHKDKLVTNLNCSNQAIAEVKIQIEKYEHDLEYLQRMIDDGKDKNKYLQSVVSDLTAKIELLQAISEKQGDVIEKVLEPEMLSVDCQTEFDQASVSTQVDVPCLDCEKRNAVVPNRIIRRFFWEPLKCLFQVLAVICFVCALCALCGVRGVRGGVRGECRAAPWRWVQLQDLMDLLFRIEYTAEVPM